MSMVRPPVDPEFAAAQEEMRLRCPVLNDEVLAAARTIPAPSIDDVLKAWGIDHRDVTVPGPPGAPDITLALFTRQAQTGQDTAGPGFYWIHGGGMVLGDRLTLLDVSLEWLARFGGVLASVEYRLAPQARGTDLVEDCYAGLVWFSQHAAALGVDPARIVVAGSSAGGGLAAGVALLARDRGGPAILAQVLDCPMLDCRNTTVSSHQYGGDWGGWTREMNAFGWAAVVGDTPLEAVSPYVSPALARDLSGLPPAYITAGSAEVFRDEDVEYASRIWAAGGQAELHVWAGGFHGFDVIVPSAAVSVASRAARTDWIGRQLGVR